MKLDEILSELTFSNDLGKLTISGRTTDQKTWNKLKKKAKADILKWILKQIPEKKEIWDSRGDEPFKKVRLLPEMECYNEAIDDITAKFKESE